MLTFVYGVFFQCQLYLEMHVILTNKEHSTTYYDLYLYFYSFKIRMRLFLIVLVFRSKSKSKCFCLILTTLPCPIFRNRKCQTFHVARRRATRELQKAMSQVGVALFVIGHGIVLQEVCLPLCQDEIFSVLFCVVASHFLS